MCKAQLAQSDGEQTQMAVPTMSAAKGVVDREMFDDAIRQGERSVMLTNRHMRISRHAIDAIVDALELLKSGRAGHARDRLDKALLTLTRMSKP
jgi:hypothetical protein